MQMARSIDSDYIDLSLMDGFDMGIDFDGFEENVKKIMELPIKYLDSAHGKAVELLEDVHAMLWAPFPDGEVPNKLHETFKDPSNSNVTGSSPTSIETKLVGADAEVSNPASLIALQNCFTGCSDMDAHETESVSTKNSENASSKGDNVKANDMCLLPEDTLKTEVNDCTTSEEITLWNPEHSARPSRSPVKISALTESTTISEDDYVPHAMHTDIPLESSSANYEAHIVSHRAKDPVEAAAHEAITHDLDGQVDMKNDKFEASYTYLQQNTSFKKMFMRNLSSKLRLSKKQASVQQAVPAGSQDEENLGYHLVSSSDDLDDDWEVL